MVLHVRVTWFMNPDSLKLLQRKVLMEQEARKKDGLLTAGDELRILMCFVELYTHIGEVSQALATARQGLSMGKQLSKEEKVSGAIPMILYFMAKIYADQGNIVEAKGCIKKLREYGKQHSKYNLIYLKLIVLSQQIGETDFQQDFTSIYVPAGRKVTVSVDISDPKFKQSSTAPESAAETKVEVETDIGTSMKHTARVKPILCDSIEWAWFVEKHTIAFRADFEPNAHHLNMSTTELASIKAGKSPAYVVQSRAKNDSEGRLLLGEFRPSSLGLDAANGGVLHLTWDNTFSKLRSKTVRFRFSPSHLQVKGAQQ